MDPKLLALLAALVPAALPVSGQAPGNVPSDALPDHVRKHLEERGLSAEEADRLAAKAAARRGPEAARRDVPEKADAGKSTEASSSSGVDRVVATYPWPPDGRAIPLSAEIQTVVRDGFPEKIARLSGDGLLLSFHAPAGVAVDRQRGEASARFASPLQPENRMDVFLFPPGAFLPTVNRTSLLGYVQGLEKEHGEALTVKNRDDLMPGKTFAVLGERWGVVRYRIERPDGPDEHFADYIVPLRSRILVLRLAGDRAWVEGKGAQAEDCLSTLDL